MEEEKNIATEEIQQEPEPSSFKLIFTLGIAGFLAGLVLVGVYLFTKPMIAQNKADTLKEAVYTVLDGATSFEPMAMKEGTLVPPEEAETAKKGEEPEVVYLAYNEQGQPVGFAIRSEATGFQDVIAVLFGYDPWADKIVGMEVLESKETPGLGDKIYKDEDFAKNFESLEVEPKIVPVKPGEKTKENEVVTITGATISSVAVVEILNLGIEKWKEPIRQYIKDNNLEKGGGS